MCSSAPAVDNSGQNAAALQQAGLSAEQLAWSKEIYAETADDRAYATEQAKKISEAALESMQVQTNLAKDYDSYNKEVFRPLEKGIVADAVGYDTAERRDQMAGQAIADVDSQAVAARDTMAREAMARGVDPSSGNFAASQGAFGVREAAAKAAAGNTARTQVETIGAARKMDAANLGRGLASSQATSAGLALTAGNSSGAAAQQPLAAAQSGAQILNSGAAGAQQGLAGAAQTYGQIADSQAKANAAQTGIWGALGQVGGAAITKWSDKTMKEDIEPVDGEAALEAVNATPVSNWAYKAGSKGDDGGATHTGPMAQDVKKNMGEKAAPKGKKIDLVSLNGITMAALQGLTKRVDQIAAAAGVPA
ncbi:MAG: tail fiber domain-containing protein [Pseudomonadota bacterium]